jgi:hypothetical protein
MFHILQSINNYDIETLMLVFVRQWNSSYFFYLTRFFVATSFGIKPKIAECNSLIRLLKFS